jgi:putative hemolysin
MNYSYKLNCVPSILRLESCGTKIDPVLVKNNKFLVKLACDYQELEEACHLRYLVFKKELGYLANLISDIDIDQFDYCCFHLLVLDISTNEVIATCRLRLIEPEMDMSSIYSRREFFIKGLDHRKERIFEIGRACVIDKYRSGGALAMMYHGMARLVEILNVRFMLGCASMHETSSEVGWSVYQQLTEEGFYSKELDAMPTDDFQLPSCSTVKKLTHNELFKVLPPLIKGYLRMGAKIASPPALDLEFGSIDFLIWFDNEKLPSKYCKHFKAS